MQQNKNDQRRACTVIRIISSICIIITNIIEKMREPGLPKEALYLANSSDTLDKRKAATAVS
jgi:hypothetical protein